MTENELTAYSFNSIAMLVCTWFSSSKISTPVKPNFITIANVHALEQLDVGWKKAQNHAD